MRRANASKMGLFLLLTVSSWLDFSGSAPAQCWYSANRLRQGLPAAPAGGARPGVQPAAPTVLPNAASGAPASSRGGVVSGPSFANVSAGRQPLPGPVFMPNRPAFIGPPAGFPFWAPPGYPFASTPFGNAAGYPSPYVPFGHPYPGGGLNYQPGAYPFTPSSYGPSVGR